MSSPRAEAHLSAVVTDSDGKSSNKKAGEIGVRKGCVGELIQLKLERVE